MLNDRQQAFVNHYIACGVATTAAKRAGYSDHSAHAQGHRLLNDAEIQAAITARRTDLANQLGITRQWVLEQLRTVADKAIAGAPKTNRDGEPIEVDGVRVHDWSPSGANRALELLGKELGMFVDRAEVHTVGDVVYTLDMGGALAGDEDDGAADDPEVD